MAYKNYIIVLFKMYKIRKISHRQNANIRVLLRNGTKIVVPNRWVGHWVNITFLQSKCDVDNISELNLSEKGISFRYKGHYLIIDLAEYSDPYCVFFRENIDFSTSMVRML